ncbi:hypothetical protein B296_00005096 [Ensete ventricosum]|uniref:3'-5' exonuclease domain-containing protein n=1 Tax=Ensete ventricosum TaxID=4639 RepID=A0A427B053_ENSVE|nr:hypothetical protein B296_00005096 [Ensete ventricosum]
MEPFQSERPPPPTMEIHMVAAADSPEFALLCWALRRSPVIGLDAEWKPNRTIRLHHQDTVAGGEPAPAVDLPPRSFPTVSLLQIACRVRRRPSDPVVGDSPVFLVDLLSVPLVALWGPLRDMFESSSIIKLGFRFKQDLVYLSSTFSASGCDPGFDRVIFFHILCKRCALWCYIVFMTFNFDMN